MTQCVCCGARTRAMCLATIDIRMCLALMCVHMYDVYFISLDVTHTILDVTILVHIPMHVALRIIIHAV